MEPNDYINLEHGLDFTKINEELIHYSTGGKRLPLVKILRKVLWRLVRPFHFYQIGALYNLYRKNQNLNQICDQIQNQNHRQHDQIEQHFQAQNQFQRQIQDHLQAQEQLISFYKTEYIALVNRIAYLENELELLKSSNNSR